MEDYCVEITGESTGDCTAPVALDTMEVNNESVMLAWDAVSAAESYLLRYRPMGQEVWTILAANTNAFDLQGLSFCTAYEAQVRSVCEDMGSEYSDTFNFSTACSTSDTEVRSRFGLSTFPNPFKDEFYLQISLDGSIEFLNLDLFNAQGQHIQRISFGSKGAGKS